MPFLRAVLFANIEAKVAIQGLQTNTVRYSFGGLYDFAGQIQTTEHFEKVVF